MLTSQLIVCETIQSHIGQIQNVNQFLSQFEGLLDQIPRVLVLDVNLHLFPAALIVFNAERINALAAQHHKYFTDQPYFDKHGIFFSAVVSAPLLLSMFILLVSLLMATLQRTWLLLSCKLQQCGAVCQRQSEGKIL